MAYILLVVWFTITSLFGWIFLSWIINAYVIPTFFEDKWYFLSFEKAFIISAILTLIILVLFSKSMYSSKLALWMSNRKKYIDTIEERYKKKK